MRANGTNASDRTIACRKKGGILGCLYNVSRPNLFLACPDSTLACTRHASDASTPSISPHTLQRQVRRGSRVVSASGTQRREAAPSRRCPRRRLHLWIRLRVHFRWQRQRSRALRGRPPPRRGGYIPRGKLRRRPRSRERPGKRYDVRGGGGRATRNEEQSQRESDA